MNYSSYKYCHFIRLCVFYTTFIVISNVRCNIIYDLINSTQSTMGIQETNSGNKNPVENLLYYSSLPKWGHSTLPYDVAYEGRFVKINKKPTFILSTSVSYLFSPPKDLQKILKLIHEAGFNALHVDVIWSAHEQTPGNYDFSHPDANLLEFINLAGAYGFYLIVNIGPILGPQYKNSGIPGWIVNDGIKNITIRSNDPNWFTEVRKWYEVIISELKRYFNTEGGPVILVQLESNFREIKHKENFPILKTPYNLLNNLFSVMSPRVPLETPWHSKYTNLSTSGLAEMDVYFHNLFNTSKLSGLEMPSLLVNYPNLPGDMIAGCAGYYCGSPSLRKTKGDWFTKMCTDANKTCIWIENWLDVPPSYSTIEKIGAEPARNLDDLFFASLNFIARGGAIINFVSSFPIPRGSRFKQEPNYTKFGSNSLLDEYGYPKEQLYNSFKRFNKIIANLSTSLLSLPEYPEPQPIYNEIEVFDHNEVIILCNYHKFKSRYIWWDENNLAIEPWSCIVYNPAAKKILYDSSKPEQLKPNDSMRKKIAPKTHKPLAALSRYQPLLSEGPAYCKAVTMGGAVLKPLLLTKQITNYSWYFMEMPRDNDLNNNYLTIPFESQLLYVFADDQLVEYRQNIKPGTRILMPLPTNITTIISVNTGNQQYQNLYGWNWLKKNVLKGIKSFVVKQQPTKFLNKFNQNLITNSMKRMAEFFINTGYENDHSLHFLLANQPLTHVQQCIGNRGEIFDIEQKELEAFLLENNFRPQSTNTNEIFVQQQKPITSQSVIKPYQVFLRTENQLKNRLPWPVSSYFNGIVNSFIIKWLPSSVFELYDSLVPKQKNSKHPNHLQGWNTFIENNTSMNPLQWHMIIYDLPNIQAKSSHYSLQLSTPLSTTFQSNGWFPINRIYPTNRTSCSLKLNGMTRGTAYINGKFLGRYSVDNSLILDESDFDEFHYPNFFLNIPLSWLKSGSNVVLILEEIHGESSFVSIKESNREPSKFAHLLYYLNLMGLIWILIGLLSFIIILFSIKGVYSLVFDGSRSTNNPKYRFTRWKSAYRKF